ncbi:c2 domain containing protein [Chrysochromulina tobinii]|uniref:C2 domain containing protein n=1 Tax=Chrysochromulina tobinii TaxID=1460289 RepID=A0A0M0K133_9EUKA|nr:c2 domain containing protein [Chrysochromulina tobinii]|eukprot:KOO32312.1 c2 domain containing protein [Chrysochromulina sp. CCMP291]
MRTRHPEAFSAEDPAHWTNRIGEPTGDADADCLTPDEWASSSQAAPEGWEWVDQRWMVDAFHNEKISSRQGWLYAPNFEVLRRNLIDGTSIGELEYSAQVKSAAESGPRTLGTPLPVRWRRWVRRRKRSDGADEALEEAQKEAGTFDIAAAAARRIQRRPSSKERAVPKREFKPGNWGQQTGRKDPSKGGRADRAAGGLAQEVEETDIVCEGWLRQLNKRQLGAKHEPASRWKQVYAILIRGTSFGVGTLVITESFEACPYKVLSHVEGGSPQCNKGISGLHANASPFIPDAVCRAMSPKKRLSCFGIGSKHGRREHTMVCALSAGDAQRWILALNSLEGEESQPGALVVKIIGATTEHMFNDDDLPSSSLNLDLQSGNMFADMMALHRNGSSEPIYASVRLGLGDRVETKRCKAELPVRPEEETSETRELASALQVGNDPERPGRRLPVYVWKDAKFLFHNVFDDKARVTVVVATQGPFLGGLGEHALGQLDFTLHDLTEAEAWIPNPPPQYGPRKAEPTHALAFPTDSTLPIKIVTKGAMCGAIKLEVSWVPGTEGRSAGKPEDDEMDDKTDRALRKYLAHAYKERTKDNEHGEKTPDGLRIYTPEELLPIKLLSKQEESTLAFPATTPVSALVKGASLLKSTVKYATGYKRDHRLRRAGGSAAAAQGSASKADLEGGLLGEEAPLLDDEGGDEAKDDEEGGFASLSGVSSSVKTLMRQVQLEEAKTGEYQLRVHVLEARGLVAKDLTGTSDPYVKIKAFGQERYSQVRYKSVAPVWDENLFIIEKDVSHSRLDREQIEISVWDWNLMGEDLIGSYFVDASWLYFNNAEHRIFRKWLVLTAPAESREGGLFLDDSKEGAQGYLQVTIQLIGPGDELIGSSPEEEKAAIEQEIRTAEEAAKNRKQPETKRKGVRILPAAAASAATAAGSSIVMTNKKKRADGQMTAMLRSPSDQIKTTRVYLRVGVHRATGLPDLDTPLFPSSEHLKGGRIDAYAKIEFAGNVAKTETIQSNQPVWNSEYWMPVLWPCSGQQLRVSILDADTFKEDDMVGEPIIIDFDDIMYGHVAELAWYNLYGVGSKAARISSSWFGAGRERREIHRYQREYTSEWQGKVLLELHVLDPNLQGSHTPTKRGGLLDLADVGKRRPELPEKVLTRTIPKLTAEQESIMRLTQYELRALVLEGCNLGANPDNVIIEIAIEDHTYVSKAPIVRANIATWRVDDDNVANDPFAIADDLHNDLQMPTLAARGELRKVNSARLLELPEVTKKSRESLPTVFVYLTRQSTAERTHFARFRFEELVARGLGFAPLWVRMRSTSPMPIRPGEPPPAVLISMGLGCEPAISNKNAFPWPPVPLPMRTTLEAYELRVHLYQARGLPARSDDGLLDPYVVVSLAGTKAKNRKGYERSTIVTSTKDPLWFETLTLQAWLPPLELAPQIVIEVWDQQNISVAEIEPTKQRDASFVGCCILSLRAVPISVRSEDEKPRSPKEKMGQAQWMELLESDTHASGGQVLISMELLPLDPFTKQEQTKTDDSARHNLLSIVRAPFSGKKPSPLVEPNEASKLPFIPTKLHPRLWNPPIQTALLLPDRGATPLARAPALKPSKEPLPEELDKLGIQPAGQPARLHLVVMGLRGLKLPESVGHLALAVLRSTVSRGVPRLEATTANPYVEIDVGVFQRAVDKAVTRTPPSIEPSARSPNYFTHLMLGVALADDDMFAPTVNVKVYDKVFGGLAKPLIGSCSFSLKGRLEAASQDLKTAEELQHEIAGAKVIQRFFRGLATRQRLRATQKTPSPSRAFVDAQAGAASYWRERRDVSVAPAQTADEPIEVEDLLAGSENVFNVHALWRAPIRLTPEGQIQDHVLAELLRELGASVPVDLAGRVAYAASKRFKHHKKMLLCEAVTDVLEELMTASGQTERELAANRRKSLQRVAKAARDAPTATGGAAGRVPVSGAPKPDPDLVKAKIPPLLVSQLFHYSYAIDGVLVTKGGRADLADLGRCDLGLKWKEVVVQEGGISLVATAVGVETITSERLRELEGLEITNLRLVKALKEKIEAKERQLEFTKDELERLRLVGLRPASFVRVPSSLAPGAETQEERIFFPDDVTDPSNIFEPRGWPPMLLPATLPAMLRARFDSSRRSDAFMRSLCRFLALVLAKVLVERIARLRVEIVETWENERKTPGRGWSAENLLPCDPPRWSEVGSALSHPDRRQFVPPAQWVATPKRFFEREPGWTWVDSEWAREEWRYAVAFEEGGKIALFDQGHFDVIRLTAGAFEQVTAETAPASAPASEAAAPAAAVTGSSATTPEGDENEDDGAMLACGLVWKDVGIAKPDVPPTFELNSLSELASRLSQKQAAARLDNVTLRPTFTQEEWDKLLSEDEYLDSPLVLDMRHFIKSADSDNYFRPAITIAWDTARKKACTTALEILRDVCLLGPSAELLGLRTAIVFERAELDGFNLDLESLERIDYINLGDESEPHFWQPRRRRRKAPPTLEQVLLETAKDSQRYSAAERTANTARIWQAMSLCKAKHVFARWARFVAEMKAPTAIELLRQLATVRREKKRRYERLKKIEGSIKPDRSRRLEVAQASIVEIDEEVKHIERLLALRRAIHWWRQRTERADESKHHRDSPLKTAIEKRRQLEEIAQKGIDECEAAMRELLQRKASLLRELRRLEGQRKRKESVRLEKQLLKTNLEALEEKLEEVIERLARYEDALDSEQLAVPEYMLCRKRIYHEAERVLQLENLPYLRFPIRSGQGVNESEVGVLKAMVVLLPENQEAGEFGLLKDHHQNIADQLTNCNSYVVRLYVLRALNLLGSSDDGNVDAYLKICVGQKEVVNTRSRFIKDCFNTAHFFEVAEFVIEVPGDALVTVEVWDRDFFAPRDALVGATILDLEDRVYSPMYTHAELGASSPRPPLEWRLLYQPHYRTPTGTVEMWCEILSPESAEEMPVVDIKPPEEAQWELRVIVWQLEGVRGDLPGMDMGDMADFQVAVAMGGTDLPIQRTDTHWRARSGKASFNWRLKFPVTLSEHMKYQRLTVQLWDRDILTSDYMIGDATLNLDKWFRRTFKKRKRRSIYWDGDRDPRLESWDPNQQGIKAMLSGLMEGLLGGVKSVQDVLAPDPEVERAKLWIPLETAGGEDAGRLLLRSLHT